METSEEQIKILRDQRETRIAKIGEDLDGLWTTTEDIG